MSPPHWHKTQDNSHGQDRGDQSQRKQDNQHRWDREFERLRIAGEKECESGYEEDIQSAHDPGQHMEQPRTATT